jgi:hypothetical protein
MPKRRLKMNRDSPPWCVKSRVVYFSIVALTVFLVVDLFLFLEVVNNLLMCVFSGQRLANLRQNANMIR